MAEETGLKKENFKEAFARNRRMGEKTFEFQGKKYTTDIAEKKKDSGYKMDRSPMRTSSQEFPNRMPAASAEEMEARPARERAQALEGSHPEAMLIGGPAAKLAARAVMGGKAAKEVKERIEPTMGKAAKQEGKASKGSKGRSEPYMSDTARMEARGNAKDAKRAPRDDDESRMADEGGPNFKRGGKVSSASSRGDGCAVRGKTKGRMV